ncbi:MAG TPA: NAD(P)-dependent alcohol dehydrogenase [Anaerolineae bacterium]|nr:NAD(P)-dependent alcohol dehydrogenase [Anaerolineae bacterium]
MKIRAAIVRQQKQPLSLEEVELEDPRPDEVLVRLVGAGICHTDLVARDQYYPVPHPVVCGHEGAGIVERVGAGVHKVKPGDHVVLTYMWCGRCPSCLAGQPAYCRQAFALNFAGGREDGSSPLHQPGGEMHGAFFGQFSFATHALAHERNTVKVSPEAPLEILGPLGCGVQTGAGTVMNALRPTVGSSLVIFGAGAVGLSALLAAKLAGCSPLIAVDIKPNRLDLARVLGATHLINAAEVADPLGTINRITRGGADYTLEATGLPHVFQQAVHSLAPGGVCAFVGAAPFGMEASFDMNTILAGRTIRGVVAGHSVPDLFIPQLIRLYLEGCFPFDRLIKFYPFAEINQAIADSESGATVKPVLRFE